MHVNTTTGVDKSTKTDIVRIITLKQYDQLPSCRKLVLENLKSTWLGLGKHRGLACYVTYVFGVS